MFLFFVNNSNIHPGMLIQHLQDICNQQLQLITYQSCHFLFLNIFSASFHISYFYPDPRHHLSLGLQQQPPKQSPVLHSYSLLVFLSQSIENKFLCYLFLCKIFKDPLLWNEQSQVNSFPWTLQCDIFGGIFLIFVLFTCTCVTFPFRRPCIYCSLYLKTFFEIVNSQLSLQISASIHWF